MKHIDYALYLAAYANNAEQVKLYLGKGAKIIAVDSKNRKPTKIFDYPFCLTDASDCALNNYNPYILALLWESVEKNNNYIIPAEHNQSWAAKMDQYRYYQNQSFLEAINAPTVFLEKYHQNMKIQEANQKQAAEKRLQEDKIARPFHYFKVDDVKFNNDKMDPQIDLLNEAIAVVYKQAETMFNSASWLSIGKRDKATKMFNQLKSLKEFYKNRPMPTWDEFIENHAPGMSLKEILQQKRYANASVLFANSWWDTDRVVKNIYARVESTSDQSPGATAEGGSKSYTRGC